MPVAVVTDSTAYLPPELVDEYDIEVVPLYVVLAGRSGREGRDIGPSDVAHALSVRRQQVSTSRPSPGDFVAAYRRRLAASQVGEHIVTVVDSRSAAMGTGFAVLDAARAAAEGADADAVASVARRTAAATRTLFVVDTLEHLRRGGRIGHAASMIGTALSVKPVLHVADGQVVPLEKVRTTARALVRLVQRGVEAAAGQPVMVAVHHLAAPERAERLAADLEERVPGLRELYVSELGAAIGAHVGPGAVGLVVAPAATAPTQDRPQQAEDR